MAEMKVGSTEGSRSFGDQDQGPMQEPSDSRRDFLGNDRAEEEGWEGEVERRISNLDSRRDQQSETTSQRSRGQAGGQGRSGSRRKRTGSSKLDRAINIVVEDLKDKGYTDEFIRKNRETIRSKVRDYMREGQSLF